jgi:hypothetical protein
LNCDDNDPEVTETEIVIPHDRRTLVEFPARVGVVQPRRPPRPAARPH